MSIVYTIGYEGTHIEEFIQSLLAVGIDAIADVRAIPLSRKKGFSKNSLRDRLAEVGIQYLPMKMLGDPKPGRDAAKAGDYDAFRAIYTSYIDQPDVLSAVETLASEAKHKKICLLCFERDPKTCHRTIVAERMEPYGYSMLHLFGDDPERYIRNKDRLQAASKAAA